jgi:cell division septum initiation protein DivIVA
MDNNNLNDNTSSDGLIPSEDKLKDYAMNYLIESGFVDALVRKNIYYDDIEYYYKDFRQEAYLALLELKPGTWTKLYKSAREKKVEFEYEIRNYVSRIVMNTCRSTSSNAYRKIKKPSIKENLQDATKWEMLSNKLVETKSVEEQIKEFSLYN